MMEKMYLMEKVNHEHTTVNIHVHRNIDHIT